MADGAVHVDTTGLTLDEVIDRIVALAETAGSACRCCSHAPGP